MNMESFLHEELQKIDLAIDQNEFRYHFTREIKLTELIKYCISEEIYYFESKDEDFKYLGIGNARNIKANEIDSFLNNNPHEYIVYQGMFEKNSEAICYLPEWSFISKDNMTTLHIHFNENEEYLPKSADHFEINYWNDSFEKWKGYFETPSYEDWSTMIDQSKDLFKNNILEKLVLSRKRIYNYETIIDPKSFFHNTYHANLNSTHYNIFYQANYNEAFTSFTPEKLFSLKGNLLESISLAGSTQRGQTQEEDKIFEKELIESPKLIHEHGVVTEYIKEKLTPLVKNLEISKLFTMKLPYIQHREALIKGELKQDTKILELINLMHPTPAVGGIPFETAQEKIIEIEKSKRDYYAAPTGVISKSFTEIAVGIRSAYLKNDFIIVFGGAGITAGSEAQAEWNETGTKMGPFTKVINRK